MTFYISVPAANLLSHIRMQITICPGLKEKKKSSPAISSMQINFDPYLAQILHLSFLHPLLYLLLRAQSSAPEDPRYNSPLWSEPPPPQNILYN